MDLSSETVALKSSKSDFKSEKELCDFIEDNVQLFCLQILNREYSKHTREFYLTYFKAFGANKPRVDFFIKTKEHENFIIEVKNPKNTYGELINSVSQVLSYLIIAEENKVVIHRAMIVCSRYDVRLIKIIKKFKLPIDVCVLQKRCSMTYFFNQNDN